MSSKNIDTRKKILQVAAKLLVENKGSGVRMSDIAKAASLSRQAIYLHFTTRAELLEATTKYLDEIFQIDKRLAPSRAAKTGVERLERYIDAWGNYIPEIYGVAHALMSVKDTDDAAAAAWNERMYAMRDGCRAAVEALANDGKLNPALAQDDAIDLLWTLLSVRNWENLTLECGWSHQKYIDTITLGAKRILVQAG